MKSFRSTLTVLWFCLQTNTEELHSPPPSLLTPQGGEGEIGGGEGGVGENTVVTPKKHNRLGINMLRRRGSTPTQKPFRQQNIQRHCTQSYRWGRQL